LRALIVSWALVGVLVLLVAAGWLFGKIAPALVPFGLALVIVFMLRGPVAALERRGWHRGLAVGVCYLVGFAALAVVFAFIVPPLVAQLRDFVRAFPSYYDRASAMVLDLQNRYQALVVPAWLDEAIANLQDTITRQSAEWSAVLAREIFSVGGSAVTLLGNGVLAFVVAFWLLKDLPKIYEEVLLIAGPARRDEVTVVTGKVSRVLSGYLRGQMVLSSATAVIVAVGLAAFGVPYSLVIGLIAGVFNVIPWIGPALTAVIAGIAAAFVSPWLVLAAVGVCVGAQQVTEIFVQPRVMSTQVDLHPLVVIFSLLAGGTLFGFIGLVLAIPVAAVAKGLFVHYFEKYTDSTLATEDGALFRAQSTDACRPASENDSDEPTDDRPTSPEEDRA
jgi:predicted PurR-regulated permease PerM